MKKLILCMFIPVLILISCATTTLQISENDQQLQMIGGKEALLDAIVYPDFALRKGIEGQVLLMAYVDTSGKVLECEILEGNDYLNDAAIAALKSQRFYPYLIDGVRSPVRVAIPISFSISKEIDLIKIEDARLMPRADQYLNAGIQVLKDANSSRSPGKSNDYYSEGISWWPVSGKPDAPYIIKDNKSNPQAFLEHKNLLEKAADNITALTSLYLVTGNKAYSKRAIDHIRAWFINSETAMSPHMKYAQSIPNRSMGRATGIYEAMPLIEIIRAIEKLKPGLNKQEKEVFEHWLKEYSKFLIYDDFGINLRAKKNTYAIAWLAQMVTIADYLNDKLLLENCKQYFEEIAIPYMLAENSLLLRNPDNLLFENDLFIHLDYLSVIATTLSNDEYNAWLVTDKYGRRAGDLVNYMYSGVLNNRLTRSENYRGRYTALFLAGKAYNNYRYLDLWRNLQNNERDINFPVREVLLW